MKTYHGTRLDDGCVIMVTGDGPTRKLDPRLDLWNHSPDGFEWGYGGSGPAQSALAVLADATGNDEEAVSLHQDFKRRAISQIKSDSWEMTVDQVMDTVRIIKT